MYWSNALLLANAAGHQVQVRERWLEISSALVVVQGDLMNIEVGYMLGQSQCS
jgi:hypothetical protein